jgi:dihydrofolate reductase
MAKVTFVVAMSLDGFVSDCNGAIDTLYPDFAALRSSDLMREMVERTGAVLMGRRTFEMAEDPDWYAGNYEFQRPIFVVTDLAPECQPRETAELRFIFVTDGLESALCQAKTAAGDKQVSVVGGPAILQQLLRKGWLDELQVGVMPVLLCQGLRLFDCLQETEVKLEKTRVKETDARTDIWFRVVR